MRVVIIGGVAGGASAAARLRRLDENAQITLLERGAYISYANCGLPYYVGGEITQRSALTLQTPQSFKARFNVDVRTEHEATAIDPAAHTVRVRDLKAQNDYTLPYDKLIYAPGAAPVTPGGLPADDPRVFTLRTIPDTLAIRQAAEAAQGGHAVIVGAGPIGVEMAENLMRAGLKVTLVEMAPQILTPLDLDMAGQVAAYLRAKGVQVLTGNALTGVDAQPDALHLTLAQGRLEAQLLLLAIGVRPESGLAKEAGLALNARGAVVVDAHMRTSDADIYAVGDVVEVEMALTGEKGYLPLAGPANKQGRIAADNICGIPSRYRGSQGSSILKCFDMTVAATGLNTAAARRAGFDPEQAIITAASHAGYYPGAGNMFLKAIFDKATGRVLGAQLFGDAGVDKRADVLATAIGAKMTAADLTELELCYAPPYGSAKDPVNMIGYVMENLLTGKVAQFREDQVADLPRDGSAQLIDVRTPAEYAKGHVEGFVNLPVDDLRDRMGELDPSKPVYLICQSALRSYIACRMLTQRGFTCAHLSGGYRLYAPLHGDAPDPAPVHPCGLPIGAP